MTEPSAHDRDLTRPADLKHKGGTGASREQRPLFVDRVPPCNAACPAGEDIQGWLALAQAGRYREAWELILDANPLPAVHGRVCYHPCEGSCNRAQLDSTVSIHAVERFLGDLALSEGWTPTVGTPSGKRVLIVGAGPSGLSAAYHLARMGHAVEVRDAEPTPGGMMRYGIPAYRLPRDVLDGEIARIAAMGVTFTPNHRIKNLEREWKDGAFDAVFVAVGAHLSKRIDIPSRDAVRMVDALALLRDVESGVTPLLGRRVAIYGGGNTAMDAARTVLRLGYEPLIVYRRDYKNMTALPFEADEALEEGVRVHWLRSIASVDQNVLRVEVMEIGEDGKPRGTGLFENIEADAIVLAVGQDSDTQFLAKVEGVALRTDGTVEIDARQMTGRAGLFAGGDMVPADRSVTVAVGHGKDAARSIDAWLRGAVYQRELRVAEATFDTLHLRFFADVTQRAQEQLNINARRAGFGEVVQGLNSSEAQFEAQRCLSCGNCFECDGCVAACPEDAVLKLGAGQRYRYDYDRCTGCAECYEQCPCGAIAMIPEPSAP